MNDELGALGCGGADLEESASPIGADQHGEFIELEDSYGIAVGVQHVVVGYPVLAGARQDDRVHLPINIT